MDWAVLVCLAFGMGIATYSRLMSWASLIGWPIRDQTCIVFRPARAYFSAAGATGWGAAAGGMAGKKKGIICMGNACPA